MTPASDVRGRLTRLLTEAAHELAAMRSAAAEVEHARRLLDDPAAGKPTLALVAVELHRYYTACESLLERIARVLDESLPDGPSSHRDLLEQMCVELPPVRPAVLDRELGRRLHKLLSFRHFFRHAYNVELERGELRRHADNLVDLHPALVIALERFEVFVRTTRDALPSAESG